MSWFEKLMPSRIRTEGGTKKAVPEGLWAKCPSCSAVLYRAEMERNMEVCPKCGHHNRIGARRRLDLFLDPEPREEIAADLESSDPLKFKDSKKYKERLAAAQKQTGEKDALIVMRGLLKGRDIVAAAFEFAFMGGSMGSVVGERFVRGVNMALERRIPLVSFAAAFLGESGISLAWWGLATCCSTMSLYMMKLSIRLAICVIAARNIRWHRERNLSLRIFGRISALRMAR